MYHTWHAHRRHGGGRRRRLLRREARAGPRDGDAGRGGPAPRGEPALAALEKARIPVELTTGIRRALWEKYILICAVGGMTALTRCPIGVIRDTPETWAMFRRIVEEVAALGAAAKAGLAADVVDQTVKFATGIAPASRASLAEDLLQGRRLELDALHGHAVRLV